MAIQNDPRMYSGGAVVFDSSPTVDFFVRQQAKNQAKKEALNQYFSEVLKDVNPAGIRQVHLGGVEGQPKGIVDEINAWKDYWQQNQPEILKGGIAQQKSALMVEDIKRKIQAAKNRDKFLLELGKAQFEGKYDPDDDELKVLDKVSKSIYDPASYKEDGVSEYGYSDVAPPTPELDFNKKYSEWSKGYSAAPTYDEKNLRRDKITGLDYIPFQERYSNEQIAQIGANAGRDVLEDKNAMKSFKKRLEKMSEKEYRQLNEVYKEIYGGKSVKTLPNGQKVGMEDIIDSPEKLAMAEAAVRAKDYVAKEGEITRSDYEMKKQDKIAQAILQSNLILSRKLAGGDSPSKDLNKYDLLSDYDGKTQKISTPFLGDKTIIKTKDIGAQDLKLITADGVVSPYNVDGERFFVVRDDGDWEGAGGKVVSRANVARANLDRTTISEEKRIKAGGLEPKSKPQKQSTKDSKSKWDKYATD